MIEIDGHHLQLAQIAAVAANKDKVRLTPSALERMSASQHSARATAKARPVYGRSTGVGANRSVVLDQSNPAVKAHGLNLLRSHAVDAGRIMDRETIRAMLLVRLSQLAAGSSGVDPGIGIALQDLLNSDSLPEVREFGGIGTADLPALAGTALTILGERPLLGLGKSTVMLADWSAEDALPFISSNALTIAQAALAQHKLATLIDNLTHVSALSFTALSGNPEAFSPAVAGAAGTPAVAMAANVLWTLVGGSRRTPARIQDPYCLRTLPLVLGSITEELEALKCAVEGLVVAGHENPLVFGSTKDGTNDVAHHGLFEMTILAKRTDALQSAIASACATIIRRIGLLCDPVYTGLNRFLAVDSSGSSGVMMLEYVAAAAAGRLRDFTPASDQTVVLSLGAEDDASFASVATRRLAESVHTLAVIVGVEFLCATRALKLQERSILEFPNLQCRQALQVGMALSPEFQDRDLRDALDAAYHLALRPMAAWS